MFSYLFLLFPVLKIRMSFKIFILILIFLNNINVGLPLCSIVTADFNARCSRWLKNGIINLQGQELDSFTLSAGYNQITDKPTHNINNSLSCIDLAFCSDQSVISNHGIDVSIFDKCHHNIIYGKINKVYLSLQHMCKRSGIMKKQILKILRKQHVTWIGIKLLKISQ